MGRQLRHGINHQVVCVMALIISMIIGMGEAAPPGIDNPSQAKCLDDKFKTCYNLVHVCPKFCPNGCTVDCQACKPVCIDANTTSPPPESTGGGPVLPTPSPPPSPAVPTMSPLPPPTPSSPSPSYPPSENTTTPPTSTPPSQAPSPGNSEEAAGARRMRCRNKNYPQCYGRLHVCPSSCPQTCQVDCNSCKPVCSCDMPGAVCQDPRFIGADGITFYFHGKKDKDFCLVSDPNLHINAHFIGKRNENMKRDFTWVQSVAVLFGHHRLFLGARKTTTWNDAVDRLSLSFDGEPIFLDPTDGASWRSDALPSAAVRRDGDANCVTLEVAGIFKISAKVVPITQKESRIHNYGISDDDCFAHLELGFKFYSLSGSVNGVLGQTYGDGYVSRVNMGSAMPVIGGDMNYAVSNLFATDCKVSQFKVGDVSQSFSSLATELELPSMKCGSGMGGRGVVCKR